MYSVCSPWKASLSIRDSSKCDGFRYPIGRIATQVQILSAKPRFVISFEESGDSAIGCRAKLHKPKKVLQRRKVRGMR